MRPYRHRWTPLGVAGLACLVSIRCGEEPAGPPGDTAPADRIPPVVTVQSPSDGAVVKGIVPVSVQAEDDSPIDSVWVEIRDETEARIHDLVFGAAPYAFDWDTRFLPQAEYHLCAAACDSFGNRSAFACNAVRAYPRAVLRYDDGGMEGWRGATTFTWQVAAVFHNPYDVAVQVDTVMVYIHQIAALGAPFRFVLWNVSEGRPTSEAEGTPELRVRSPRNTFGYFTSWTSTIPPGGAIAAGWQQTGLETTAIGEDSTSTFTVGTFFYAFPAGVSVWARYEEFGYAPAIPMIRVHVSVVPSGPVRLPHPQTASYGTLSTGPPRKQDAGWLDTDG